MRAKIYQWVGAMMVLCLLACSSKPANLSGTWYLNTEKSRWGSARKPLSVAVTVAHEEPSLEYYGSVVYENEESRPFSFKGAVDGKEYPITRSFGPGRIVIHREGSNSWISVCKSEDGRFAETVRTTVSKRGQVLTRHMSLRGPQGSFLWTEVCEKR